MNYIINKIITNLDASISKKDVQYFYFGHSYSYSNDVLNKGIIEVKPESSDIESLTTGIIDQNTNTIKIILAKSIKTEGYKNAKEETLLSWASRVCDGREADGSLKTNSIRYVLRNNMRSYGTVQRSLSIEYDSKEDGFGGAFTTTLTLVQEEQQNQPLN